MRRWRSSWILNREKVIGNGRGGEESWKREIIEKRERKTLWTTANTHCFIFKISSSSISFAPFVAMDPLRLSVRSLGVMAIVR